MSDITKCTGIYEHDGAVKNCPYAQYCYRFTATASFMQSWYVTSPYQPSTGYKCADWVRAQKISKEDMYKVLMTQYMSMLVNMFSDTASVYAANKLRLKSAIKRLKEQK
jgi:hypothetical protein